MPRLTAGALAVALLSLGAAVVSATTAEPSSGGRAPNVLLVITDDQPWNTLPLSGPAAMPWLESRLADPTDRWVRFTNAFVNVPLCCPSRASILTGRHARHTGVQTNDDGAEFDESSTLATWLADAGYQTAFIGKYLNGYPWNRGPYVPQGWDRFLAKRNLDVSTTYLDYPFVDQGVPLVAGSSGRAYATTMLETEATSFLEGASAEQPWFLVFAPSAPHEPWTPAPEDAGPFADAQIATPSERVLNDVRGKPDWIRQRDPIDGATAALLELQRRHMLETLGAVDRSVRSLVQQVEARGELDRTLIVLLSDNGYSFGEHRWVGKRCPYDACVRTPLVIRSPWGLAGSVSTPVSNVDLAPTILDLAGLDPAGSLAAWSDGVSLRPLLDHRVSGPFARRAVVVEWAGDAEVPAWRGLRTESLSYVEHADGTLELYDVAGVLGPADPHELHNLAEEARFGSTLDRLAALLRASTGDMPFAEAA
ncbi:hypothetical protein BH18ACT17_BH18ACT17_01000 [soil metagenome]